MQGDKPRRVFHGTTADSVDAILSDGLQPREATDRSNWADRDVPSIPGHVYLTHQYAPHFGDAARDGDEPIAVVEVDLRALDRDRSLFPDEDFIEQALRGNIQSGGLDEHVEVPEFADIDLSGDMRERTEDIRDHIDLFRPYWELSLATMGNISHRGAVPPEAIPRVSVVEMPPSFRINVLGDGPSILDAAIGREKHELVTEWMMGGDVTGEDIAEATLHTDELPPGIADQFQRMLDDAARDVRQNPRYTESEEPVGEQR